MKHTTSHSYDIHTRELPPKLEEIKSGTRVLCPFCEIPHPLVPGVESQCGTSLRVTAVQTIVPARLAKKEKIACLKCHKIGGGEMVRFMNGFVHLEDCLPGTRLMVQAPNYSKWAERVYRMNAKNPIRAAIEKRQGLAQQVMEIDPAGQPTGKVLGYFFYKK